MPNQTAVDPTACGSDTASLAAEPQAVRRPVKNVIVPIDARKITDEKSFHAVFAEAFGFPTYYGKNMNAWVDCMTSLDVPDDGMSKIHVEPGHVVIIQLDNVKDFAARCPKIYADLIECSSFVNWRRIDQGHEPVLALSFAS